MSYCPNLAELLYAICREPDVKICRSREVHTGHSVLIYARNELIRLQCVDDRNIVHDFNKQRVERISAEFNTVVFCARSSQPNFVELIEIFAQSTSDIAVHDEILRKAKEHTLRKMTQLAKGNTGQKNGDASEAALLLAICQKPDTQICSPPKNGGLFFVLIKDETIKLECQNEDEEIADPGQERIETINVLFRGSFFDLESCHPKFEELVTTLKAVKKDLNVFSNMLDTSFKSSASALAELSKNEHTSKP